MFLSIIVPVYNEEKNIEPFIKETLPIAKKITDKYEIIFCLDPSTDQTEESILKLREKNDAIKLIKFSRRVGQPMATLAGLQYSSGDIVVPIDVDLQDPPSLIYDMWQKHKKEGWDVIMAQRKSREGETIIKKIVSYVGYKVINKITDVNIPINTGDFRLMTKKVVNEIIKLKECHGFLRGLVALVGFKQTTILYERDKRFAGKGNYNRYFGSLRIGLNGIICFSNYMLTLSSKIGFFCAIGAFSIAILYFFMKAFTGFPFPIGNPTIVILVLFIGGIQLISVGVLGEYIGRIYEEVKQRPKFIVDKSYGIKNVKK